MKILLLDCSPKVGGNTSYLIDTFIKNTNAEIKQVKLFPQVNKNWISPCIDCGGCSRNNGCVLNDDFKFIIEDVYDIVVFVSPIYMSNLPGPAFNLISRFNYLYNNKKYLNISHIFKLKRGILILLGGGNPSKKLQGVTNEDLPIRQVKYIFNKLNATLTKDDTVICLNTDDIEISKNDSVINKVIELSKSCNG